MNGQLIFSPADFVAIFNQSVEVSFGEVIVRGELSGFRISKNAWLYFKLKDELASVDFFGAVRQLPGPLEDGMLLRVHARPFLHARYGFSLQVNTIEVSGQGSIKKAFDLLKKKLEQAGLFDTARKRSLPYPPEKVGLITSIESAAYGDFTKIIASRWPQLVIQIKDVQVQGEAAVGQIVEAIEHFNRQAELVDALVIIRGGGSNEDLQAFSSEPMTRAIAASRIPTMLAIGHERDISLAELAADVRASTPSNAAETLVPDVRAEKASLKMLSQQLRQQLNNIMINAEDKLGRNKQKLKEVLTAQLERQEQLLRQYKISLAGLGPFLPLRRGYALISKKGQHVSSVSQLSSGDQVGLRLQDGQRSAKVV